jgi:hypothetical protein
VRGARAGSVLALLAAPAIAHAHAVTAIPAGGFGHFFLLGVDHIFSGFDHLLFVAGLLLVAPSVGHLARVVTAFTLAHSISLALGVTGVVGAPPWLVEPAIAATVVFVGVENLVRPMPRGRAPVAFAFGLVHGLGFAGTLSMFGLTGTALVPALAGFNLGVEAGQLCVVLAAAPVILAARRTDVYRRVAVPVGSAAISGFGVYFLILRLFAG